MICCTVIALLFGSVVWFARKLGLLPGSMAADPLRWRLESRPLPIQRPAPAMRFDWRVRARGFRCAFNGVYLVLRSEHSAWIHLGAAACAIVLGVVLQIDLAAWRWIILCIGMVIASEIINTAIENACDAITTDTNAQIGLAKDMGAGAVLLCSITALIIGGLTFTPFLVAEESTQILDLCGF